MVLILNMFLFVDLRQSIYNPFYARSKRAKVYYTISIAFTICFSIFQCIYTYKYENGYNVGHMKEGHNLFKICIQVILGSCVFITTVLIIVIIKNLTNEGTSQHLRIQIMIRYLFYFLFILLPIAESFEPIIY